jgi:hypothetical protein
MRDSKMKFQWLYMLCSFESWTYSQQTQEVWTVRVLQDKAKLRVYLIKHYIMKTYGGVTVYLHTFSTSD